MHFPTRKIALQVNHLARTTQWSDPRPLSEGWQMKFDDKMKRHYFVNHIAKTTQWQVRGATRCFSLLLILDRIRDLR